MAAEASSRQPRVAEGVPPAAGADEHHQQPGAVDTSRATVGVGASIVRRRRARTHEHEPEPELTAAAHSPGRNRYHTAVPIEPASFGLTVADSAREDAVTATLWLGASVLSVIPEKQRCQPSDRFAARYSVTALKIFERMARQDLAAALGFDLGRVHITGCREGPSTPEHASTLLIDFSVGKVTSSTLVKAFGSTTLPLPNLSTIGLGLPASAWASREEVDRTVEGILQAFERMFEAGSAGDDNNNGTTAAASQPGRDMASEEAGEERQQEEGVDTHVGDDGESARDRKRSTSSLGQSEAEEEAEEEEEEQPLASTYALHQTIMPALELCI